MTEVLRRPRKKLLLVELNEVNFDLVASYVSAAPTRLPAFSQLLSGPRIETTAEDHYEQLEPWIQWPSVHTGLAYHEHGVFRLGDIVGARVPQVFEQLEQCGYRVGCISAMNVENRLQHPAYFVPDPWTNTFADSTWWSRGLAAAISQAVGDNSEGRISARSAFHFVLGLLRFATPRHYATYVRLALGASRARWRKALFLDLLLHDIHTSLFRSRAPDFSTLFVNAGAHIQHHYLFNSAAVKQSTRLRNPTWYVSPNLDPFAEMLQIYDKILGTYLRMTEVEVMVATGLSQRPYDRIKFYYRLRNHAGFLKSLGVKFRDVHPRMTRDFLVEFDSVDDAAVAEQRLSCINVVGNDPAPLFADIDNRGASLFVTLTYPSEISASTMFDLEGQPRALGPHVVFVAIKNGMHQGRGFAFFTPGLAHHAPSDGAHVKELYRTIMGFFAINGASIPAA